MSRFNKVNIIVGRRGSGKTHYTLELVASTSLPKVLICDTFDHPSYDKFENITLAQLSKFSKGVRHLFGADTDAIFDAVTNVHNAFVIYEDATKYIEDSIPKKVKNYILDTKQKNIDLAFLFHSLGDVPPKLFRWADTLTIFKTSDIIEKQENRILQYNDVKPVWERVMAHPSPYYKETILIN